MDYIDLQLPEALKPGESEKLFEEYARTRSPEIKERIFLGNMKLIMKILHKHYSKFIAHFQFEDFFQMVCERVYDILIDGYHAKMQQTDDKFTFGAYLEWQIRSYTSALINHEKKQIHNHALSLDKMMQNNYDEDESYFEGEAFSESDIVQERRFNDIELDFIESKYFSLLTDQERYALTEWYIGEKTQMEIAKVLGVCRYQVSILVDRAIAKLQNFVKEGAPKDNNNERE